MLSIAIQSIPHDEQRYETVGDYWEQATGERIIRVSAMTDERYEFLVALHEMIEQYLCSQRGIPEEIITKFDEGFELKRPEGNTDEPGDAYGAPYRREHFFATSIERLMAAELGVDWNEYEKAINSL